MAKRDILKEAIADAKTVKETAIANAKAALEEAFTPRLKEMLATKLEEMDLEEEEEKLKEAPMKAEKTNKKGQPDMRKEKEYKPEKMTRDRIKEEDLDEEIDKLVPKHEKTVFFNLSSQNVIEYLFLVLIVAVLLIVFASF